MSHVVGVNPGNPLQVGHRLEGMTTVTDSKNSIGYHENVGSAVTTVGWVYFCLILIAIFILIAAPDVVQNVDSDGGSSLNGEAVVALALLLTSAPLVCLLLSLGSIVQMMAARERDSIGSAQ
jgi:hypothetical protein